MTVYKYIYERIDEGELGLKLFSSFLCTICFVIGPSQTKLTFLFSFHALSFIYYKYVCCVFLKKKGFILVWKIKIEFVFFGMKIIKKINYKDFRWMSEAKTKLPFTCIETMIHLRVYHRYV